MQPDDPSDEEVLFRGIRFDVVRLQQPTHGEPPRPRDVIRHPGSVVILPLVDDDTVCLIRNYRIAVWQTLIELPAGTLEIGEDPMVAARRELTEETGYRAAQLRHLCAFYAAPGNMDEEMTLVLATGLTPGPPQREAGEEIENLVVPWSEAIDLVREGQIRDAKTMLGLLYYAKTRG